MTVAGRVAGRRSDFRQLAAWKRARAEVLLRDGRRCRVNLPGCEVVANEADHIVPVQEGGARLDKANLRAACGWCNKKRNGERSGERRTIFRLRPSTSPRVASPHTHRRRHMLLTGDFSRQVANARG